MVLEMHEGAKYPFVFKITAKVVKFVARPLATTPRSSDWKFLVRNANTTSQYRTEQTELAKKIFLQVAQLAHRDSWSTCDPELFHNEDFDNSSPYTLQGGIQKQSNYSGGKYILEAMMKCSWVDVDLTFECFDPHAIIWATDTYKVTPEFGIKSGFEMDSDTVKTLGALHEEATKHYADVFPEGATTISCTRCGQPKLRS